MKKLMCLILLFSLNVNADCVWKTGITPGPNNTFIYNQACHEAVGALVKSNADLTQALQLKDLALQTSDQRTQLWTKTAEDEQTRLMTVNSDQSKSNWLYFGLGCLTVIATGFMTARLIGR
jgi:hypothetical protein